MTPHNSTQENENWICPSCENTGYCQCETVKALQSKVDGLVEFINGVVLACERHKKSGKVEDAENTIWCISVYAQEALKTFNNKDGEWR